MTDYLIIGSSLPSLPKVVKGPTRLWSQGASEQFSQRMTEPPWSRSGLCRALSNFYTYKFIWDRFR